MADDPQAPSSDPSDPHSGSSKDSADSIGSDTAGERAGGPYRWRGLPLTSGIATTIIEQHFSGRRGIKRSDIAGAIEDIHLGSGGHPGQQSTLMVVKKALQYMSGDGRASKSGAYGRWDFVGGVPPVVDSATLDDGVSVDDGELPLPERILGAGTEAVYVFGYATYRDVARERGEPFYPCKVGRTSVDVTSRVFDQATTAMPEWPTVWLVIRTDNSRVVEKMLHSVLVLRGRSMDEAPGSEWFLTNPEEIESIHDWATSGVAAA